MNNDFSLFPDGRFPVYTLSTDQRPRERLPGSLLCRVLAAGPHLRAA